MTVLHEGEPSVDVALVRALVDDQQPQWSHLPLAAVPATGTDHHLFRLGDDLLVRVPRAEWAAGQALQDARCLPLLAPHLTTALPLQVALGSPAHGYPWHWSVCRWIPGRTPDRRDPADRAAVAEGLGRVCRELQAAPTDGGPVAGADGGWRGVPLADCDVEVRRAIAVVSDELHGPSLLAAWEGALAVAPESSASWLHGDLTANNLVVDAGPEGRPTLVGVIDWGSVAIGDPAADAAAAWSFLTADERATFLETAAYDDATCARGRGWALATALVALPYYRTRSRAIADNARRTVMDVLADAA